MQLTNDGGGFDTLFVGKCEGIGWKSIYSRSALFNGIIGMISDLPQERQ